MGCLPSREASGCIRTLRYGSHEIGLIPLTRQFFNKDNPELCQQFIRVRNDPNVRYSHMRTAGYCMDELPPANYTPEDLDALIDSVEESLFDTNEDFLNAGAGPTASFSVAEMHRILQREGLIDSFDPHLDLYAAKTDPTTAPPEPQSGSLTSSHEYRNNGNTSTTSHQDAISTSHDRASDTASRTQVTTEAAALQQRGVENGTDAATDTAAHLPFLESRPISADGKENVTPAQSSARTVANTFRRLKAELQAFYREVEKDDSTDYAAKAAALSDLFRSAMYRRFKRAVRPLPCAMVFIYVNNREEHDYFAFQGHRINVIGCFGLRTCEDERDDTLPVLQIRKGIVKAAGDRTLERVLALAAKSFVDSFTEVVLRELQRRPASVLLRGVGKEARTLLREVALTHEQQQLRQQQQQKQLHDSANPLPIGTTLSSEPNYDPVSVANALFFERMSKYPLLCYGLFNNYPTLKFIFDFSALAISVDETRSKREEEHLRLCTYQRGKDERGLAFLFPGRLLACTWLWSATQMQPPTVHDSWVQYTLNEYARSRERRVQQWLETSPTAKVMFGNAVTTRLFVEHLNNLHSEIVRARTTPTEDSTSWANAQEYSYDSKLYRIFISPICGPLLTTIKMQKAETGKRSGGNPSKKQQQQQQRTRSPLKQGLAASAARAINNSSEPICGLVDKESSTSQLNLAGGPGRVDAPKKSTIGGPSNASSKHATATTAATVLAAATAPPYSHPSKRPSVCVGAREDGINTSSSPVAGAQPPSYSALARGAYPITGMPTYPSQQALQQIYLQAIGGIAVPTMPSGAPWMLPQFLPSASSSNTGVVSQGNSINQPPPPPPPPSPPNNASSATTASGAATAGTAATYILQIGTDGQQTLTPISLGHNAPVNAACTSALPTSYQMPTMASNPGVITPGFSSPSSFPGFQQSLSQQPQQQPAQNPPSAAQQLFPLASASSASAGVYYTPAASFAPMN